MAARSQVTIQGAKTIVNRITDGHTTEDAEVHALYEHSVSSADYAEGVTAFLEKRAPASRVAASETPWLWGLRGRRGG